MDKPKIRVIDSGDLARITISGAINLNTATCEEILSIHPRIAMAYNIHGLRRIINCGYSVDTRTGTNGLTLLMLGAYSDRFAKKVEFLLENGAKVNLKSDDKRAIDIAIEHKSKKVIKSLLKYKAKVSKSNIEDINKLFGKTVIRSG